MNQNKSPKFFQKTNSFIKENPNWPKITFLRKKNELFIGSNWNNNQIINLFDATPPLTTKGAVNYVDALRKKNGINSVIKLANDTWINKNFTKHQSKDFYKKYKKILTPDTHLKRIERLTWVGRSYEARRMLPVINKNYRNLYNAKIILRRRGGNPDSTVASVPKNLKKNEGLIYERLRWRRKTRLYDTAFELIDPLPNKLEYEKTFFPFILLSKKRYFGYKYEFKTGENDYKKVGMGIVLKRRDNADIVKHTYGGVIDILMNEQNLQKSIDWLQNELHKLLDGKFPLEMLVITKSLRGYYKNPNQIAHKVLADRIGVRDPGNKPSSNDRIPYAYIKKDDSPETIGYKKKTERRLIGEFKNGKPRYMNYRVDDLTQPKLKKKIILQGDRIEHIDYINENDLEIDHEFYITNQIMNPVKQVLDLEMNSNETLKLFQ